MHQIGIKGGYLFPSTKELQKPTKDRIHKTKTYKNVLCPMYLNILKCKMLHEEVLPSGEEKIVFKIWFERRYSRRQDTCFNGCHPMKHSTMQSLVYILKWKKDFAKQQTPDYKTGTTHHSNNQTQHTWSQTAYPLSCFCIKVKVICKNILPPLLLLHFLFWSHLLETGET